MTSRQRIKYVMFACALLKQYSILEKNRFRGDMCELWDSITEPDLVAELDVLGNQKSGLSKLITEVWNDYLEEVAVVEYNRKIEGLKNV